jgi:hypothetical protein
VVGKQGMTNTKQLRFVQEKARRAPGFFYPSNFYWNLKFFVEVARGARDIDSAGNAALAVFYALDDARRFAALGTVGRLRRVHFLLAVTCFRYFSHWSGVSPSGVVSAHTRNMMRAASTSRPWDNLESQNCLVIGATGLPGGSRTRCFQFTSRLHASLHLVMVQFPVCQYYIQGSQLGVIGSGRVHWRFTARRDYRSGSTGNDQLPNKPVVHREQAIRIPPAPDASASSVTALALWCGL